MANKPALLLRWTQKHAADEFGVHAETIRRNLRHAGVDPGDDGRYSTREIFNALAGDLTAERIRETRAKADGLELANAERRGQLINAEVIFRALVECDAVIIQAIRSSKMQQQEKEALLKHIKETNVADIARKATSGQGHTEEEMRPVRDTSKPVNRRVVRQKKVAESRGE